MIPTFTRAYEASSEISGYRILAFSDVASSSKVSHASTSTGPLMGISDAMGASVGGMCDVHRGGLVSVRLGGAVSAGAPLTSDANGNAIAATASAATTVYIIGYADAPGVADDIIDAFFAPGLLHQG